MKRTIITILLAFFALTTRAQWFQSIMHNPKRVQIDKMISGYRYLQTEPLTVLMPKRAVFWTLISMDYYEGYKNPHYIRLYSRCELSKKDILIIKFAEGPDLHLYAETSNHWRSNLGLGKKTHIYDAVCLLDERKLERLLSTPIVGIMVGWGSKWYSKDFKKDELGKLLNNNYQAICRKLEK